MNPDQLLSSIADAVAMPYFFSQAAVILCLLLYGYVIVSMLCARWNLLQKILLAFPAGLGLFAVSSYLVTVTGIPYNAFSAVCAWLVLGIILIGASRLFFARPAIRLWPGGQGIIALVLICAFIALACSGLISVTVSNDTVYNYSFYPRAIVYFGGLRSNFDIFLTDVGQGCALINTLPFLYGFNETFGIQHMLTFSLLGLFCYSLYSETKEKPGKVRIAAALLGTLLLVCTMPFLLLSKWVLANLYFAAYMFFGAYLACDLSRRERGAGIMLLSLVIVTLSILRIEGGVYAALLILLISTLEYKNTELAFGLLLPVFILQVSYFVRIFCTMVITAPYRFMTETKAVLLTAVLIAELCYLLFIRGKFALRVQKHLDRWIVLALFAVNVLLCLRDPHAYVENCRALFTNVLYTGGWSIFPVAVAVLYALSVNRKFRFSFWDLSALTYLLYALVVCFMREGGLREGVGDSGNRVLLQVVPLLCYAALSHFEENL